ncbi:hypothetical protein K431DRAFT_226345 [Polychaeton citri CBS 116435]|uniref:Uncharacterized protein n=1 Tax=Polychaeton citri CBS 116435 TaxID=1314669 RepID=A0A9P4Q4J1_9PEZI|nr:hypothetical protein K431DRAFT_226345 [Polychaeton citri CBS 116435]
MCIQVIERYSVCRCLYYRHSIDPCASRNTRGHQIQEKTVFVGYTCNNHASGKSAPIPQLSPRPLPDSGYSSGGFSTHHAR